MIHGRRLEYTMSTRAQYVLPPSDTVFNLDKDHVARQQHSNTITYNDGINNYNELQWIPPFQLLVIYSQCFYNDYNDHYDYLFPIISMHKFLFGSSAVGRALLEYRVQDDTFISWVANL